MSGETIGNRKCVMSLDLETAINDAVEAILKARERFREWIERIRPEKTGM